MANKSTSNPQPTGSTIGRGRKKGAAKVSGSGRKKGTPNKATTEFRKVFSDMLQNEINQNNIQIALQTLMTESPKDYLATIIKIAQFNLPQLQSVEFNGQAEVKNPFMEHMAQMAGLSLNVDNQNNKK